LKGENLLEILEFGNKEKDKIITERIKRGIIITGENNQKLIDFDMSLDDFNTDDIKKLTI